MFYPDIYWKFDFYGTALPTWKRVSAIQCYKLDIAAYGKYLNRFYLPSLKVLDYLKSDKLRRIAEMLPPGGDEFPNIQRESCDFIHKPLTILYIGGLGNGYEMEELLQAVQNTDNCRIILCCREDDWEKEKGTFLTLSHDKIVVVHKSGEALNDCYQEADICTAMFPATEYRAMAQPVKVYEYLSHGLPSFATEHTAIGDFVEQNGIGWTIPYQAEAIAARLREILQNPALLDEKFAVCEEVRKLHTWKRRAEQVANGLRGVK